MMRLILAMAVWTAAGVCSAESLIKVLTSPDVDTPGYEAPGFGADTVVGDSYLVATGQYYYHRPEYDTIFSVYYVYDLAGNYLRRIQQDQGYGGMAVLDDVLAVTNNVGSLTLFSLSSGDILTTVTHPSGRPTFGGFGQVILPTSGGFLISDPSTINPGHLGQSKGVVYRYDLLNAEMSVVAEGPEVASVSNFGWRMVSAGKNILVGASFAQPPPQWTDYNMRDPAYFLVTPRGKISRSIENLSDSFYWGRGVASDGKQVFVGFGLNAPSEASPGTPGGFWWLSKSGKVRGEVLSHDDGFDSTFGRNMALRPGRLYVAETKFPEGGVAVYSTNRPTLLTTIENPDPLTTEQFGFAIAASRTRVALSAIDTPTSNGLVYLYGD